MNKIANVLVRSSVLTKFLTQPMQLNARQAGFTRSLWHMSKNGTPIASVPNKFINSTYNLRYAHSEVEQELNAFLSDEIALEKESKTNIPTQIDGFSVKLDAAEVELSKKVGDESVIIKFNVNHTVDADNDNDKQNEEQEQAEVIKSKPNFEVDVTKGDTTLSFTCSFLSGEPIEGDYEDLFGIEEITLYRGVHSEKVYACAGDILDGYFYDLLMSLLAEKGITTKFAEKLIDLSTNYERSLYIELLGSLKAFIGKK